MGNKRISDFDAVTAIDDSDQLLIENTSNVNKSVVMSALREQIGVRTLTTAFQTIVRYGDDSYDGGLVVKSAIKDFTLGVAAASHDTGLDFPAGSTSIGASWWITSEITDAGGVVAVGLGISTDLNMFGEVSAFAAGTKSGSAFSNNFASSTDLVVYATDGSGGALGTLATGTIRIYVAYVVNEDLS